jgi:hypothetical protein
MIPTIVSPEKTEKRPQPDPRAFEEAGSHNEHASAHSYSARQLFSSIKSMNRPQSDPDQNLRTPESPERGNRGDPVAPGAPGRPGHARRPPLAE